jgi:hypothetical protein
MLLILNDAIKEGDDKFKQYMIKTYINLILL